MLEIAWLTEVDWLRNSLWLVEADNDALVDSLWLSDVDADRLADSLGVSDAAVVAAAAEPLVEVEPLVLVDWLVEPLVLVDWLAEVESLVVCDVDAAVDSVADSLVGAVLPGDRTALPSVANVVSCVAVTSYEIGVIPDMVYSRCPWRAVTGCVGETTVNLQLFGPDL